MPLDIVVDPDQQIISCTGETSQGLTCDDIRVCNNTVFDSQGNVVPCTEAKIIVRTKPGSRCTACHVNNIPTGELSIEARAQKYKQTFNVNVRQAQSLYQMQVSALNASCHKDPCAFYWHNQSDRLLAGKAVASRRTRNRPGQLNAGGTGCDVKHNSYNRYLNKKKGAIFKAKKQISFETTDPSPPTPTEPTDSNTFTSSSTSTGNNPQSVTTDSIKTVPEHRAHIFSLISQNINCPGQYDTLILYYNLTARTYDASILQQITDELEELIALNCSA